MYRFVVGLTVLASLTLGDVLLSEDFNSAWSTASPPTGWRISYTPPEGSDDWHREEANAAPWLTNPTPYAAIFWNLYPGAPPDSLVTEVNCSGYRNVRLYVTTLFNRLLSRPYKALLCYSVDGGVTLDTLRDYYDQNVDSVSEVFDLPNAQNKANVTIIWVFDGDLANIKWWCIDDVRVEAEPMLTHDVMCRRIVVPGATMYPGDLEPRAAFQNVGLTDETNIPVACSLYDEAMNPLAEWSDVIPQLLVGERERVTFFNPPFPLAAGRYYIKFWCAAPLDDDRSNDTLDRYFTVTWTENLSYCGGTPASHRDWPVGHFGWGVRFDAPAPYPVYLESAKVYLDCPANPSHCRYQLAVFKEASGGGPGKMYWKSPVLEGTDGWNSVFMADVGEQLVFDAPGRFYLFYLQVGEPPECPRLGVDGTLNNPGRYWQYRAGTYQEETPPGDIMIRASVNHTALVPPTVDARTLFVNTPWYDFVQRPYDAPIIPTALVENLTTVDRFSDLVVTCSIFGTGNVLRYWDAVPIEGLANGADTLVAFRPWTPEVSERCSVIVHNQVLPLGSDVVPENDDKRFTVDIVKGVHTGASTLGYGWIDSDTLDGPTYAWIDTAGADVAIAAGTEARIFVPIGFHFPYYDTSYNYVYVCTNGWLALGQDQGTNESLPTVMPSPSPPNRCIYPWWDNLAVGNPTGTSRICFKNEGTQPNRRFTVIWQDVWRELPGGDSSEPISFEVTLHENGSILFQYADVTTGDLNFDNGRCSAVGLENDDGTDGLCYLYARPPMSSAVNGLANRLRAGRAIRLSKIYRDAAALEITVPDRYLFPGPLTPVARVQNAGTVRDTIKVFLRIRPTPAPYDDSVIVADLRPGDSAEVSFRPCTLALGAYTVTCSTAMRDDAVDTNDVISKVVIASPWVQREDIPFGWFRRKVKSATLVYAPTTNRLYAMKGANSNELWCYDLSTGKWDSLRSMPLDSSGRRAKDGCDLTFDPLHGNKGYLWAIKAGGQPDFYAYDIAADTWIHRAPVYIPAWTYRPPKKGAAIAFVPSRGAAGSVYCIPGNNSNNFYRYDISTNRWEIPLDLLGQPIAVPKNPNRVFATCKHGSDMVYDGEDRLYVMRGSGTLDVFAFSPLTNAWVDTLDPVSLLGPRNKRVKAGASMSYLNKTLYVLKGGNTQEFWSYNTAGGDSWLQRTGIPIAIAGRHRKVKRGSAMAAVDSTIFCLKGSYSNEFWEYMPSADSAGSVSGSWETRAGTMAESGHPSSVPLLQAWPNPTKTGVLISYSAPGSTHVRLRVYDRTGRLVRTLYDATSLPGRNSVRWDAVNERNQRVPAGVYVLRMEITSGVVLTSKLVVQEE